MIKLMRKLITGASGGFISLLSLPAIAFAADPTPLACPTGQFSLLCIKSENLGNLISSGLTFIFVIATIIALGWLIYGAFKWIVSGGDKTAVEEARNHITAAIVGLVIVFLAYFILSMVIYFFTGQSLQSITLPKLNLGPTPTVVPGPPGAN